MSLDPFKLNFVTQLEIADLPNPYPVLPYIMIHPGIEYFDAGWNGYKYWITYTPLPNGNNDFENVCVAASNDLVTWDEPSANPVYDKGPDGFNADTDIFYDSASGQLCVVWKVQADFGGGNTSIRMIKSTDGVNWSADVKLLEYANTVRVAATPSLMYNDTLSRYELIIINAASADPQNPDYELFTCPTLDGTYSLDSTLNIPSDPGTHWWNLYIKRLSDGTYVGMGQDTTSPGISGEGSLFWLKSATGDDYDRQLAIKSTGFYRCCFTLEPENGAYKAFIAGVLQGSTIRTCDLTEGQYPKQDTFTYVLDRFNREDGPVGEPEVGSIIREDPIYSIVSEQLNANGSGFIVWEASHADCVVEFDAVDLGTGSEIYVVGRYQDANNYIKIGFSGQFCQFDYFIGGVSQGVSSVGRTMPLLEAGDRISVEFGADYAAISVQDRPYFRHENSDLYGATGFGIQTNKTGLIMDNLRIGGEDGQPATFGKSALGSWTLAKKPLAAGQELGADAFAVISTQLQGITNDIQATVTITEDGDITTQLSGITNELAGTLVENGVIETQLEGISNNLTGTLVVPENGDISTQLEGLSNALSGNIPGFASGAIETQLEGLSNLITGNVFAEVDGDITSQLAGITNSIQGAIGVAIIGAVTLSYDEDKIALSYGEDWITLDYEV